jgi:hypothetical protein
LVTRQHWLKRITLLAAFAIVLTVDSAYGETQTDVGLKKPVTLAAKGEALSDIAALMQQQTGVRLRVARGIADQKATVFADGKSLGSVMNSLATVFGYRWTAQALDNYKVYTFSEGAKPGEDWASLREKADAAAVAKARKATEEAVQLSLKSKDERKRMRDDMLKKYPDMNNPEVLAQLDTLRSLNDDKVAACAAFYKTLPSATIEALWNGADIFFDSTSTEKEWQLPDDFSGKLNNDDRPHSLNLHVKLLDDGGKKLWVSGWCEFPGGGGHAMESVVLSSAEAEYRVPKAPSPLPQENDQDMLSRKITLTSEDLAREAGIQGQDSSVSMPFITKSDLMALLHRKLGVQIVSDHYSDWDRFAPVKEAQLKDMLETELDVTPSTFEADWSWNGGILLSRVKDPGTFRFSEPPNRLLKRLRAACAKQGYLGLEERADIAALPIEQRVCVEGCSHFFGLPELMWLCTSNEDLRLYGLLSKEQRSQAFAGGISVEHMTPEQQDALSEMFGPQDPPRQGTHPVGIYIHGRRADVPNIAPLPVRIEIKDDGMKCIFSDKKAKSYCEFDAPSADDALQQARNNRPDAERNDIVLVSRSLYYHWVIQFSDDSALERQIYIPTQSGHKWTVEDN